MTSSDQPTDRLPSRRGPGQAERVTMDTEPEQARPSAADNHATGLEALDREALALFERIGARLGLPIAALPQHIDRYELRGLLGRGGMGVVHLAFDPKLGREVALKLVGGRPFADLDLLRARLLREANVLAQLEHPNIVRIYDVGEHEGEVFIALERVDGTNLRTWKHEHAPSRDALLRVLAAAGSGLAAAHARGIVHRDFKPDNVLVAKDGRVLVSDFGLADPGIARAGSDSDPDSDPSATPRLTGAGELLGTLGYMAPEQLRGDEADASSDQFAFCVSAWELLTEQRPFVADSRASLLVAMARGPALVGEPLPRWLRAVLIRGLALDPAARFADMQVLVEQLELGRTRKRRWLIGAGLGAAALVSLASASVAWMAWMANDPPPCPAERALATLRESDELQQLERELADAGLATPLRSLLTRFERRIAVVCPSGRASDEQQLEMWIAALERIARSAPERSATQLASDLRQLDAARHDRPPPTPIDDRISARLLDSEQAEREDRLDDALALAEQALALAESPEAEALARLRRGRALALLAHDELALAEFSNAYLAANRVPYPDANLRASLLVAKTAIMRLDQLERGREWLDFAESHFGPAGARFDSPRWTDYHQLEATLAKLDKKFPRARAHQHMVILRSLASFDGYALGLALMNLGTLCEANHERDHAKGLYRLALALLPTPSPNRRQVAQNLGRILLDAAELSEAEIAEARRLLGEVVDAGVDQQLAATTMLASLEFKLASEHEPRAADELRALLEREVGTPRERFEAWQALAFIDADLDRDPAPAVAQTEALAAAFPDHESLLADLDFMLITLLEGERAEVYRARLEARMPSLSDDKRADLRAKLQTLLELAEAPR